MEFGAVQNTQKDFQTQSAYQSPNPQQDEGGEGGAAIDFWGILRRRFFLISFFILIAIGAGVLYMLNATKIYTAEGKVQIFRKAQATATEADQISSLLLNNGGSQDAKRHVSSFVSNKILHKVLVERKLIKQNTFQDVSDKLDKNVGEYLKKNLVIGQDKENENLYKLSFSTPYAEEAPEFLQQLITAYREELVDNYRTDVKSSVIALQKLIDNYRADFVAAEKGLEEFRKVSGEKVIDDRGLSVATLRVQNLSEELSLAEKELRESVEMAREVKSWEMAARSPLQILRLVIKIPDEKDNNYLESRAKDHAETYKRQISGLQVQLKLYGSRLGPKNDQIVRLKEQLASAKLMLAQVEAEDQLKISKMEPADRLELEVAKISRDIEYQTEVVNGLRKDLAISKNEAESIIANRKYERELIKKRDTAQENLNKVTEKLTNVKVQQDGEVYKFQITEMPSEGVLSHPLPLKVFGICVVLGCLSGFGLAYLVDLADKTFRSPHEIIKSLNLALIGHVPVIQTPNKKSLSNQDVHPVICTFHKPKSQSAEAFRAVRTSLYFSVQGQRHQVIQVTSPTPGDGKSTLAANLATVIAQSGKSVLLVDADFRRPSVQKIFKIEETPGFSDVLVQQVTIEDAVQQTPVEGLEILACGNKPLQPSELLTSHRLPEVIDELREMYDFVVIDTPPVLLVTDPCPVAANVDGVICAMRIKKNVRVNAERMVEILRSVNANILGVVVNGVGAQGNYASQYNYGAYQAGYSQYGYGAYGYGRYGQSEKVYDDGRKASLSVPRQQLIESQADDPFHG